MEFDGQIARHGVIDLSIKYVNFFGQTVNILSEIRQNVHLSCGNRQIKRAVGI